MGSISYSLNKNGDPKVSRIQLHPIIQTRKIIDYNGCKCMFDCGGQTINQYLENYSTLPIKTHQKLVERFFSRNGDFYAKQLIGSCCTLYYMRIVLSKYQPSKKHLKKAYNLIDKLKMYIKGKCLQKIIKVKQQDISIKNILQQQEKLIQNKLITKEEKTKIYLIINTIIQQCKNFIEEVIQTENLNFNLQEDDVYIFKKQNKMQFYSNANLLLFHQNKNIFKTKNYSQNQFNELFGQALIKQNQDNQELTLIQKSKGYLNMIHISQKNEKLYLSIQQQAKSIQQLTQNQKQIKQKQLSKQSTQQNTNLINQQTFTFDQFEVGPIQITIKDLSQSQDVIDFIFEYYRVIHNINYDDQEIIKLYCFNYLNQDTYLEDQKQNIKIKLGQRSMTYSINGKVIAICQIILTQEYFMSEYFFYIPEFKEYSMGIFSMLVEFEYAKQIQKYFPQFKYHTLGYTTFATKKMKYKLQFSGTQIQCPVSYIWTDYNDQIKQKMKQQVPEIFPPIPQQPLDFSKITIKLNYGSVKANILCEEDKQDELSQILINNANTLGNELMYDFIFEYGKEILE